MLRVNFFRDPYCLLPAFTGNFRGTDMRKGSNWLIRTRNRFEFGSQNWVRGEIEISILATRALRHKSFTKIWARWAVVELKNYEKVKCLFRQESNSYELFYVSFLKLRRCE